MGEKKAEQGSVLVFVALMLIPLVFFGGMAIDIGQAYWFKSHLQNVADASALAGAAGVGLGKARLITASDIPANTNMVEAGLVAKADKAADKVLKKNTDGVWSIATGNGESRPETELRMSLSTKDDPRVKYKPEIYYYRVEMSGHIQFSFARLFLPESLLPEGWNVKVQSWAISRTEESVAMYGEDLLTQMRKVGEDFTFSTFQAMEVVYGNKETKKLTFTNDNGITYNADGTRQEIFNVNGTNGTLNMKNLFINYKPDVQYNTLLTENWDVADFANMTVEEIKAFFNNNQMYFTNWEIKRLNGPGNFNGVGKQTSAEEFFTMLQERYGENALELMRSRIASIVNITSAYPVRDLNNPEVEVSYDINGDPNKQDPLFIRLESEEFNEANGKSNGPYVANSVRDISINIQADNTEKNVDGSYKYRPMLFFYDGPVDKDGKRGVGRESNTVYFTLNEDFRGILCAPNSAVCIKGNGNGSLHNFTGCIIAKRLVDEAGNEIPMPAEQNQDTDETLQSFYHQVGFNDARFDTFGVAGLTIYINPKKDIIYLTSRASNTR